MVSSKLKSLKMGVEVMKRELHRELVEEHRIIVYLNACVKENHWHEGDNRCKIIRLLSMWERARWV